jgi:hypothetical protein
MTMLQHILIVLAIFGLAGLMAYVALVVAMMGPL